MASEVEPASAPTPVPSPNRQHYQFFWEFLTFKVDCVLFQLPKYRFVEDSPTFAGQYGIGLEHTDPNGSGPSVIELDATPPDFEYFIKAMYPRYVL
ncbi:hypothetical protein FA15DRAFT_670312 [Coprinopsis marcescibilis]|uniref:BTB domain-containing protein n=1 Tax=Coprinopsis marcescibilis TaxID=230819 RepID=A0A5C3KTS1_COPMA|nr:hypothetical protein FA15DRAFT_670312 [Coprinopsis marcescibilis]